MASGHGADLGLGTGLGGAPAADDATRLDVWPPCGHRQRLTKGGAMGSPLQQTTLLPQGPLLEAAQVGRWSQAVVADYAPLHGLPAASCQKLQAGAPYSTSAPPSYLFDPRPRPLPNERPAGGPARRQGAARRGPLPIVQLAAARDLVATGLWRRGRPRRTLRKSQY